MKSEDKGLILKAGIWIGAYFLIGKPLLQAIGLMKTKEQEIVKTQEELTNKENPFSPQFYQQSTVETMLLKRAVADAMTARIWNALGFFSDDEAAVISVFRALKTQSQVSFLANVFQSNYKTDLLRFLKNGKGVLPQAGLNADELSTVITIVNNLPKYNV